MPSLSPAPIPSESRAKILDVAEALFARRGYAGVGLAEVAAGVGLRKSSLFHHFPTKLDLYSEVIARVLDRLEASVRPATRSRAGHAERLDHWIDAIIDVLAEHPTTARLVLRSLFEDDALGTDPENPPVYEATLARLIGAFQRLVADGVKSGAFRAVSPGHLTQTLIGATVYHFASADLGDEILGARIFSADQVSARKREVKALVRHGLAPTPQS